MPTPTKPTPPTKPEPKIEPETEVMLSIARSHDGQWRVVFGERGAGEDKADIKSKGWGKRTEALAELARLIPRLQRFLVRGPKRSASAGVEARS
jgi:hypothetical protein